MPAIPIRSLGIIPDRGLRACATAMRSRLVETLGLLVLLPASALAEQTAGSKFDVRIIDMASQPRIVRVNPRPNEPSPEETAKRESIEPDVPAGTAAASPELREEIDRDAKFLSSALGIVLHSMVASQIDKSSGKDVLLLRWVVTNDAYVTGVTFRDTPSSNDIWLEVSPQLFSSEWIVKGFLQAHLLKSTPSLTLREAALYFDPKLIKQSDTVFGGGFVSTDDPSDNGLISLHASTMSNRLTLAIVAGKQLIPNLYPREMLNIPERFPPLSQVAKSWTLEEINRELGKDRNRDVILADELIRRRVSQKDLEQIIEGTFDSSQTRSVESKKEVISVVIGSVNVSRKAPDYESALRGSLAYYQLHDTQGTLSRMIRSLSGIPAYFDVSTSILDVAEHGQAQLESLDYLMFHGTGCEVINRTKALRVPAALESKRQQAINMLLIHTKARTGRPVDCGS